MSLNFAMASYGIRIHSIVATALIVGLTNSSLLGVQMNETTGEEFLNEYLSLDESRYLAEVQEFRDTAIEIDLIDGKRHRHPHQDQPRVLYQIGESEQELPECSDRSEVCSKVDLYGAPWVERQCRCPGGRSCPSSLHADDGHTIVDKTRQYKLCEPVKRLPICRYFKDVTWTLAPGGGPGNATVQRVHCRCRPGSVPYLVRRQQHVSPEGNPGFIYAFACSPQSRLRCQHKEPCRLFTVRKRRSPQLEEVNASPLCQCPKGHRCPRRHTDPGSLPARSYSGVLEIKTYSGYCVPSHHSEPVYTL
ncbi:protein giant-lens [Neodiprion lecontei]|uniref:Protein giant-lens n=1 Tax=Neodiprion lecontei TaxID=441921 RepID=A0A6J0C8I8_NEOLC|nr:protein giant-lens [Neodiprion lecontei]XP_046421823.1 protein giant-lens [Neodiprion fabricii]